MKFAEFEVDERAGALRRGGDRVKLQDLPFRLLVVLLRRAGSVVTREELRAELWGRETFVDAEAGLNTAIAKIREALGDNADTPVFIETLPKRGYRFIGTMAGLHGSGDPGRQPHTPDLKARPALARWQFAVGVVTLAASALTFAVYIAFGSNPDRVTIAVVRFHNETGVPDNDRLAGTLTDAVVVALADNPRYGVIGNSPLLVTERIFQDVQKIGEALHADFVVLGQVQNGDNGLLTRAHFIRVSDQKHLWAGKIDLPTTDTERVLTKAVSEGVGIGLSRSQ